MTFEITIAHSDVNFSYFNSILSWVSPFEIISFIYHNVVALVVCISKSSRADWLSLWVMTIGLMIISYTLLCMYVSSNKRFLVLSLFVLISKTFHLEIVAQSEEHYSSRFFVKRGTHNLLTFGSRFVVIGVDNLNVVFQRSDNDINLPVSFLQRWLAFEIIGSRADYCWHSATLSKTKGRTTSIKLLNFQRLPNEIIRRFMIVPRQNKTAESQNIMKNRTPCIIIKICL